MNSNVKFERSLLKITLYGIIFYFFLRNFTGIKNNVLQFLKILTPFLTGLAISYIVNMPMEIIERRFFQKIKNKRIRRAVALVISYILVIGFFTIVMIFIIPQVIRSIQTMRFKFPAFLQFASEKLKTYELTRNIGENIQSNLEKLNSSGVFEFLSNFLKSGNRGSINTIIFTLQTIFSTTFNILLALIFSIYALLGKEKLIKQSKTLIYTFTTEKRGDLILHVLRVTNESFQKFIGGRIIDALIVGILCFIILIIFNIPYASVISVAVGFTNIIPIVGPFIGGAFGFIMIVISNPVKSMIFLVIILVLQQLDGNFIFPKIAGKSMGLPAIWTLLAVSMGGSLFGIWGILFFVPLFNVVYKLLFEFSDDIIKQKQINPEEK